MARKRAKLQIQNLDQDADHGDGTGIGNGGRTGIFKGLAIYVRAPPSYSPSIHPPTCPPVPYRTNCLLINERMNRLMGIPTRPSKIFVL
jgi:hypothetical protein